MGLPSGFDSSWLACLLTVCGLGMTVVTYALVHRWASHVGYQGWRADLYPAMVIMFALVGALVLFLTDLRVGFDGRRLGWAAVLGGGAVTAAMAGGAGGWSGDLVFAGAPPCGTAALVGAFKTAAGLLVLDRQRADEGDQGEPSGR